MLRAKSAHSKGSASQSSGCATTTSSGWSVSCGSTSSDRTASDIFSRRQLRSSDLCGLSSSSASSPALSARSVQISNHLCARCFSHAWAQRPPATVCVSARFGEREGDSHAVHGLYGVLLLRRRMMSVSITTGSCNDITATAGVPYSLLSNAPRQHADPACATVP